MFPIKELPFELRALIYPHALILQPDNTAPNFLLALAADTTLYAEARSIYRAINAILATKNQDAFGQLKMSELMRIRHLKCVFPNPHSQNDGQSMDCSPVNLVKQFLRASKCGISQINIRFDPWTAAYAPYTDYGLETDVSYYNQENRTIKDIEALNRHLGVVGTLWRVVTADVEECWLWDAGKGGVGTLTWMDHPEANTQAAAEKGKGNVYERSARAWTRDLAIRREL